MTRSDNELCVGQIAVLPEFQKRGIGSQLIGRIIEEARADGEHSIVLSTHSDLGWNQPWYETFGFRVVPAASFIEPTRRAAVQPTPATVASTIDMAPAR